jgi:SAM-dependent methyltransferase
MSNSTPARFHQHCVQYMPDKEGILLNVGCGAGNFHQNVNLKYNIWNCDKFRVSVPNFTECDLDEQWPYPDNKFDALISLEVIEHVENPWHFLREAKRVCKVGATMIITTPNCESERSRRAFTRTGRFPWFQHEHVTSQLRHITPVFHWQMAFMCQELKLMLEQTPTWTPQPDMQDDNWIFKIKKVE